MHIRKRLTAIASYVRNGSRVADIGTDHGFLPLYLIENDISPSCIASDVREGPASAARNHIAAAGQHHRIEVRVGDGLETVGPDEVDDIVIAGMGGETITAILEAAQWVQNPHYRLILQPMSHAEILRHWLYTHGFTAISERLLTDGGKSYILLVTAYDGERKTADEFMCFKGDFDLQEGRPYWQKTADYLQKRAKGCASRGETEQAGKWQEIAKKLRAL